MLFDGTDINDFICISMNPPGYGMLFAAFYRGHRQVLVRHWIIQLFVRFFAHHFPPSKISMYDTYFRALDN